MDDDEEIMRLTERLQSAAKTAIKAMVPLVYGAAVRKKSRRAARVMEAPKRILLLSPAHIGDVVISTSVIPILRSAYPSVEIGFVCGSWSRMVLENHPEVRWVHCIDHWKFNRGGGRWYQKVLEFLTSRRVALKDIRAIEYDVAISLFTKFPDFLDVSWAARIPVRLGFRESIFAGLATDLADDPESPFVHQGARFSDLLHALPIASAHFQLRRSSLPPSDAIAVAEVASLLSVARLEDANFSIVHMGAGATYKELPTEFWHTLAQQLCGEQRLVFTGRGARERNNITSAIKDLDNCINACDVLSWRGFVAAVRGARVVYCVDSMAAHVAGAVDTPCVAAYAGAAGVARWRPEGDRVMVFSNHVPCAPCHLPSGCSAMTCLKGIVPNELIRIGRAWEVAKTEPGVGSEIATRSSR